MVVLCKGSRIAASPLWHGGGRESTAFELARSIYFDVAELPQGLDTIRDVGKKQRTKDHKACERHVALEVLHNVNARPAHLRYELPPSTLLGKKIEKKSLDSPL